jgi:hypothetical protein
MSQMNQLSYYVASYCLVLTSSQLVLKDVTVSSANPSHRKHIPKYCSLVVCRSLLPPMKPIFFRSEPTRRQRTAVAVYVFGSLRLLLLKWWSFGFVHRVVYLVCSSVSEELTSSVFRVTEFG